MRRRLGTPRSRSESPSGFREAFQLDLYSWKHVLRTPQGVTNAFDLPSVALEQSMVSFKHGGKPESILLHAGSGKKMYIYGRVNAGNEKHLLLRHGKADDGDGKLLYIDDIHDYSIGWKPLTLWFRTVDSPWFELQPEEDYREEYTRQGNVVGLFYTAYDFYHRREQRKKRAGPKGAWEFEPSDLDIEKILTIFATETQCGTGITVAQVENLVREYAQFLVTHFLLTGKQDACRKGPKPYIIDWENTPFLTWIKQVGNLDTGFKPIIQPTFTPSLHLPIERPSSSSTKSSVSVSRLEDVTLRSSPRQQHQSRSPEIEDSYLDESAFDNTQFVQAPIPTVEKSGGKKPVPKKAWSTPYHGIYKSPQYPKGILPSHSNLEIILALIANALVPNPPYWSGQPRCPARELSLSRLTEMYYRDFNAKWRPAFQALICRFAPRLRAALPAELHSTRLYEELEPKNVKRVYAAISADHKKDADIFSLDGITDIRIMPHRKTRLYKNVSAYAPQNDENQSSPPSAPRVRGRPKMNTGTSTPMEYEDSEAATVPLKRHRNGRIVREAQERGSSETDVDEDEYSNFSNGIKLGPSRAELKHRDPKKISSSKHGSVARQATIWIGGGEPNAKGVKRVRRAYSGY